MKWKQKISRGNQCNKILVLWKKSIKLKSLSKTDKENRVKILITNIQNKIGDVTTDPTDIKKKKEIGEYYGQLYSYMFNKLDEIDQFPE